MLVKRMGELRQEHPFVLLFHDTHHRLITRPQEMHGYDLSHYDGVLAYGQVLADLYLETKLARRVWTWHEAADTERFKPKPETPKEGDLVWIGNWGDDERTEELREFLIQPVRDLQLHAAVYGVRYPEHALKELEAAGIEYRGWLPNFDVPDVFARYRVTVHVPRRPYVRALPGIPTIRPFEAMACGIPMVTSPWQDAEGLFNAGQDYLMAQSGAEMTATLQILLSDDAKAAEVAAHGLATVQKRHTCGHRVEELLAIYEDVRSEIPRPRRTAGQTRATALPNSSPKALAS